jgi:hypothetical protein
LLSRESTGCKAAACTRHTNTEETQICVPQVGFEHMAQVFDRAKTVHASDHTANVIGGASLCRIKCHSFSTRFL